MGKRSFQERLSIQPDAGQEGELTVTFGILSASSFPAGFPGISGVNVRDREFTLALDP
jgi:hypothetical protein